MIMYEKNSSIKIKYHVHKSMQISLKDEKLKIKNHLDIDLQ